MELRSALFSAILLLLFLLLIRSQSDVGVVRPHDASNDDISQEQSVIDRNKFRRIEAGQGQTKEGTEMSFVVYESPDGTKINVTSEFYDSEAAARAQLKVTLERFSEILERSDVEESKGLNRERIVAKRIVGEQEDTEYYILRPLGNVLWYARSLSLPRLIDFENTFLNNNRNK